MPWEEASVPRGPLEEDSVLRGLPRCTRTSTRRGFRGQPRCTRTSAGSGRHQGGRKGIIRQPARHQRGTREAGKDQLDSLGGTTEAPGGLIGQPGRHQGGRKGLIGQPARHQGGTREAGKDHLDSLGGTREAPGAVKGNPVLREGL